MSSDTTCANTTSPSRMWPPRWPSSYRGTHRCWSIRSLCGNRLGSDRPAAMAPGGNVAATTWPWRPIGSTSVGGTRWSRRQIVGALANEGGLRRQDFGHIDIRADHSLVELPADLPPDVWKKLRKTRISGKLIDLAPDAQASRKPRHKGKRG